MKVIMISEGHLDELVNAMLAVLERDALKVCRDGEERALSFRRVNYDVRVLVDAIKKAV